ncbi:MAG: NUDIX hydrolase [Parvibaculaceae bacterium]|nr:NUDIX hydrolase [Parvibaculaceae bacterium]
MSDTPKGTDEEVARVAEGQTLDVSFSQKVPEGDEMSRAVCDHCDFVHYVNPKIVVGSVVSHKGKILLCKRAIEPRRGYWTLPAGFMEQKETTQDGAKREALEEANAHIRIGDMLALYNITHISQVQIMYRAELVVPEISPGIESLEVGLFAWEDIPWQDLAFPSVIWALNQYKSVIGQTGFVPFTNPLPSEDNAMDILRGLKKG